MKKFLIGVVVAVVLLFIIYMMVVSCSAGIAAHQLQPPISAYVRR